MQECSNSEWRGNVGQSQILLPLHGKKAGIEDIAKRDQSGY